MTRATDDRTGELQLLDATSLAVVGSAMRQRLLAALSEPASAAALARRFGMSRQRIGYHMRELQRSRLIEQVDSRTRRGCTERLYRARPLAYVLETGSGEAQRMTARQDRFSWAALVRLAGSVLRDLTRLRRRADAAGQQLATLAIETRVRFADPRQRNEFTEEITAALQQIAAKYQSQARSAREFRVFLGAHASLDRETDGEKKR